MKSEIADAQYRLGATDLETVLAMVRTGTLAGAGERLKVDASTVFRSLQRIERALGRSLFERTRAGYRPAELALALAESAEQVESALESARMAVHAQSDQVCGSVRITTTDTIAHGLVAPALKTLRSAHPMLSFDLHTGSELANLTRRDADIAVRATKKPPQHLVGKHIGPIRVALYAARKGPIKSYDDVLAGHATWVAPDDGLPEHPTVLWRRRQFPKAVPAYRVCSVLTVMELVALGLGVGAVPLFLAAQRRDLLQLTEAIDECQTELWLLTHPEARHLRRVATVYRHLAETVTLP